MEDEEVAASDDGIVTFPQGHPGCSADPYHEDTLIDTSGATHSLSLEWPGDAGSDAELAQAGGHQPYPGSPSPVSSLRLIARHSPVLRRQHRLALLDGFSEIQIGRDNAPTGSDLPRIRLKEMEVSKLHATLYWDQDRSLWSIVDMGSKHGTFIRSSAAPMPASSTAHDTADSKGTRLSAPRVASIPRTLHHLDWLTIGGTTFIVHIHEDCTPCASCSPQGEEEIPLFLHRAEDGKSASSQKRKRDVVVSGSDSTSSRPRDPRKALALLKRSLLSSQTGPPSSTSPRTQQYVDRSARRRELHPDRSTASTISAGAEFSRVSSPAIPAQPSPPTHMSAPAPAPLTSTNIGHRLLMKQGWKPGTALGDSSSDNGGLVVPLDPPTTSGRAGIGVPARDPNSGLEGGDWKDEGKRRRWDEMRGKSVE